MADLNSGLDAAVSSSLSVGVFGSTGSVGTQTLDVIDKSAGTFEVKVLAAGSNVVELAKQAAKYKPKFVAISDESKASELKSLVPSGCEVVAGSSDIGELAGLSDVAINGVVGFAGLDVTLGCLCAGKRLGLANKESLIAAGPVVQKARQTNGAEIVPVDSEHAAIHQCLRGAGDAREVSKLHLTASGGPFRGWDDSRLASVSVDEALAHPTWSMGPKITIDSSTLMNKGLEVIEAFELFGTAAGDLGFGLGLDDIEVVVHPQSVVHSMVTYSDGSTIAQLSEPDMRLPIAYALAFPGRAAVGFGAIDWSQTKSLNFEPPNKKLFRCLDLAYQAANLGGTAPAWLSAANEVAVQAFLAKQIQWAEIANVVERVLLKHDGASADNVDDVLYADRSARDLARSVVVEVSKEG